MLYPKMNRSRAIVDLGGIWKSSWEMRRNRENLGQICRTQIPSMFRPLLMTKKKILPTGITAAGSIMSGL